MCGIAGICAYHHTADRVAQSELLRMRDQMWARGPDGAGEWYAEDGRVGLANRRLAIIDLSEGGSQPMHSSDGSAVVTFNGEIYNFRALRKHLEKRGHVFRSESDTEVLLHLYAEKGEAMVQDLRGMFAFAIWDAQKRSLLLARDPYGIKPLYYADDGRTFRFASQVKALLAGREVSREPDPAGWVGFYLLGSVPEPFTTYRGIRALPAGATLRVDLAGPGTPSPYFSIAETYCRAEKEPARLQGAELQNHLRGLFLDSVSHHLVADVPVGVFLSGGVDSSALVGLMRDAGQQDIRTMTLGFEEFRGGPNDERPAAEETARKYGTHHTTRLVTKAEFCADLPNILESMDQPSIDGINTWHISKAAHEIGLKVAISGLGGDELLGGYSSFRDIPRWVRAFGVPARLPGLGRAFRAVAENISALLPGLPSKAAGLIDLGGTYPGAYLLRRGLYLPWELSTVLKDEALVRDGLARLNPLRHIGAALDPCPRRSFGRVATLESSLYLRNQLLRDTDWAGMAHSLEIRVPLVDSVLLAGMAKAGLGNGRRNGKALLGNSPSAPLPGNVIVKSKTGFLTPIQDWLDQDARPRPTRRERQGAWSRRWANAVAAEFGALAHLAR